MNNSPNSYTRRSFLRNTAQSMAAAGVLAKTSMAGTRDNGEEGIVWYDGMQVNPEIDNLRVVCCYDPLMITGMPPNMHPEIQSLIPGFDVGVDRERMFANLDIMACSLSGKSVPQTAWSTIFRKSKDSWNDVTVAIKVNCQELLQVPNATDRAIHLGVFDSSGPNRLHNRCSHIPDRHPR